jgi:hypothetical protein
MTRCNSVATSTRGEVAPRSERGGDDVSWPDANLTRPKNKEKLRG